MAKYNNRHGLIWSKVDKIQTAPDMKKTVFVQTENDRKQRELKNAYRM